MALHLERSESVALIALDHPPVNALCLELRRQLVATFDELRDDSAIHAVVVHGAGRGFCAGGDRSEFGTPAAGCRPTLSREVLRAVEDCGKPVVAAMHGFAVGGGLELALACDARIAVANTRVGLPEIRLGVFPLSGTQRLPRLLGLTRAAELMFDASVLDAAAPTVSALFDRVVETREDLLPAAIELARSAARARPPRIRDRPIPGADPAAELRLLKCRHPRDQCNDAQRALLDALAAAVESLDFQAGLDEAQRLFDALGGDRRPVRPGV
jgi:enoyl-CoA hydratase